MKRKTYDTLVPLVYQQKIPITTFLRALGFPGVLDFQYWKDSARIPLERVAVFHSEQFLVTKTQILYTPNLRNWREDLFILVTKYNYYTEERVPELQRLVLEYL